MNESFKIFVDRLRHGEKEKISEEFSPDFFEIDEEGELSFNHPVYVNGEAYLAEDSLIIHLAIKTQATMPCAICNEKTQVNIDIPNFYHAQEIGEIKGGIFDYSQLLRETILLELPQVVECNQGQCPLRKDIIKYFSKNDDKEEETYKPFADL